VFTIQSLGLSQRQARYTIFNRIRSYVPIVVEIGGLKVQAVGKIPFLEVTYSIGQSNYL